MTAPTLVLVGMSVREAGKPDDLLRAAGEQGGHVAQLQLGDPNLSSVLTELADDGVARIDLVGVRFTRLGPGNSWLRRIAGHWWRERSGHRPQVMVATGVVGADVAAPGVVAAAREVMRPIDGTEAGLVSPAWEEVPSYRHHVLVCRGPRCSARGAEQTWSALSAGVRERGLSGGAVLMTAAGCMFPCNHAPVIAVQPDDTWYGAVTADRVDELIDRHLIDGVPVGDRQIR